MTMLAYPVQARQALARALKAWVENENWAPELMPAILAAGKSPAAEPPLVAAQVRAHHHAHLTFCPSN